MVRAVGVKPQTPTATASAARAWLRGLLRDSSSEKVRRYAAASSMRRRLDELCSLLRTATARERESAAAALAETGSDDAVAAAVEAVSERRLHRGRDGLLRARVARAQSSAISPPPPSPRRSLAFASTCAAAAASRRPSPTRRARMPSAAARWRSSRCATRASSSRRRRATSRCGWPTCTGSCFDTAGLLREGAELSTDAVAAAVGGDRCEALLRALTDGGSLRYRLRFVDAGGKEEAPQPTAAIKRAAGGVPAAAVGRNDPRQAIVDAVRGGDGRDASVELRPRPSPNPRLFYRTATLRGRPPPLAASMADGGPGRRPSRRVRPVLRLGHGADRGGARRRGGGGGRRRRAAAWRRRRRS